MADAGLRVSNGLAPRQGPIAFYKEFSFDLGGQATQDVDFYTAESMGEIEFIQTVHIDNFSNAAALTLTGVNVPMRLTIGAAKQAILPVYLPDQSKFRISTTLAAGLIVRVAFLNVPLASIVW